MIRRWLIAIVAGAALALLTLPALPDADVEAAAACSPNGKPANMTFTVKDITGKPVSFASFKGKVVILDFWATWCGPCKIEIPAFVELQSKYRDRGLAILGFSVDDPIEKLVPFAEKFKMNYPVLLGYDRDDVQESFGPIWGLPTTFVIGRDGKICKKHTGMATKEQFEREILELL